MLTERVQCTQYSVASPVLLGLERVVDPVGELAVDDLFHRLCAVADHDDGSRHARVPRRSQWMKDQRLAQEGIEDLRQVSTHPCSLASGE
jgi:hypothetical protein